MYEQVCAVSIGFVPAPENKVFGAWLKLPEHGDIHVLAERGQMVIGHNPEALLNGKMNPSFTNPALIIGEDSCTLQYADDKGQPKVVKLDPAVVHHLLTCLLIDLKEHCEFN